MSKDTECMIKEVKFRLLRSDRVVLNFARQNPDRPLARKEKEGEIMITVLIDRNINVENLVTFRLQSIKKCRVQRNNLIEDGSSIC